METTKPELKKAVGEWRVELTVTCPECEEEINLMDRDEWWVEFGGTPESSKVDPYFQKQDCPHCKKEFLLPEIVY